MVLFSVFNVLIVVLAQQLLHHLVVLLLLILVVLARLQVLEVVLMFLINPIATL